MATDVSDPSLGRQFLHEKKWMALAISVVVMVPCLWHRHIEAGDLGSHVYNAWLAQLIGKGQASGLYIARQWTNVLVDWALLHCANVFGFAAAEKVVVATSVLIFFWGVFALVTVASGRPPWFLTPCIAMLAYGYSFNMGFLNYYVSLGLAALSMALLWKGSRAGRVAGVLIVPFVILAHPLGLAWFIGVGICIVLWSKLPRRWTLPVPLVSIAALFGIRWYLAHRAEFPVDWSDLPFYCLNGADQLMLYGERYEWLAWTALLFGIVSFLSNLRTGRRDRELLKQLALSVQLYAVSFCATALLPNDLRPSLYQGWIGLLVFRLTTISAIFGLCALACSKIAKWQAAGFSAIAVVFFAFLYQDTKALNVMESNAEKLFAGMPYGTRVIPTIVSPEDSRIEFMGHLVDRACIGHCFTFSNYEPSSGQFRVRVGKGSPIVTDSADDSSDMESGSYEVQDTDLPLAEVYQCAEADWRVLCVHRLAEGETTGQFGLHAAPPAKIGDSAK